MLIRAGNQIKISQLWRCACVLILSQEGHGLYWIAWGTGHGLERGLSAPHENVVEEFVLDGSWD